MRVRGDGLLNARHIARRIDGSAVDERLDVPVVIRVGRAGEQQPDTGVPGRLDRLEWALFGHESSQITDIIFGIRFKAELVRIDAVVE